MSSSLPTWYLSQTERSQGVLETERLHKALRDFRDQGVLHIPALFATEQITGWHREFVARYKRFFAPEVYHNDALRVGDRRWMVTLKLQGSFAHPNLYAHPILSIFLESVLGKERVLNSLGGVISLPGAARQHEHRDLPALFEDDPVDGKLPCYAVNVLIPLVDCNEHQGTTMIRPQSHRFPEAEAELMEEVRPALKAGDALLLDYRLHHGGTANLSANARPLLYAVYSRPWLRDFRNFKKQAPLVIPRSVWRKLPEEHHSLFAFATKTWW